MQAPCKSCNKKGCGSYHDICPEYQTFKKQNDESYGKRKDKSVINSRTVDAISKWRKKNHLHY